MTKAEVQGFMAAHKLGVLGYLSAQGVPRSALGGIAVTPELEIVFDTVSSSRKYGDLLRNSRKTERGAKRFLACLWCVPHPLRFWPIPLRHL